MLDAEIAYTDGISVTKRWEEEYPSTMVLKNSLFPSSFAVPLRWLMVS
jgi:hypothetical protein